MTFARLPRSARLAATVFAALLAVGLSQPAAAQWKWKDKGGRVQYSDLPPPPTVGEADILQRPPGAVARKQAPAFAAQPDVGASAASAPAANGKVGGDPELEAKRRKAADEESAKRKAEEEKVKAQRAENCRSAQAQQRALDSGVRMGRVNEKGEREVFDDKARAEEARRTREAIASECK
jgi:hypothetical protein